MSDERKPMTDEELDTIKGRLAAITEWPWKAGGLRMEKRSRRRKRPCSM